MEDGGFKGNVDGKVLDSADVTVNVEATDAAASFPKIRFERKFKHNELSCWHTWNFSIFAYQLRSAPFCRTSRGLVVHLLRCIRCYDRPIDDSFLPGT